MYTGTSQPVMERWKKVLDHDAMPTVKPQNREVIAQILENQRVFAKTRNEQTSLTETSVNNVGNGAVSGWDPIMISMLRRNLPNLMAMDIAGVVPMTGPTGKIFAMKAHYNAHNGAEALFNEADTDHSGDGIHGGDSSSIPTGEGLSTDAGTAGSQAGAGSGDWIADNFGYGTGMATTDAEQLGEDGGTTWGKMAMSIGDVTVTAKSRGLYTSYSTEWAEDLQALHQENAHDVMSGILQNEILAEQNREFIRTINMSAKRGGIGTTTAGVFDLATDADGRWSDEKVKGLIRQIDRECNQIAKETRLGKGNFVVTSTDVVSALSSAGVMSYTPELKNSLEADDTGNTYAGNLGKIKVYIDPYATVDYVLVGYRGSAVHEAGIFYCPYVPLQFFQAQDPESFHPRIAFKTRYGLQQNPYAEATYEDNLGTARANVFYRIFLVKNIL